VVGGVRRHEDGPSFVEVSLVGEVGEAEICGDDDEPARGEGLADPVLLERLLDGGSDLDAVE
jgi:hypothetical protein